MLYNTTLIAYIEFFQYPFHHIHGHAESFIDMVDWRQEFCEKDIQPAAVSDEIWALNKVDHNDWRRQAIEEAIAEAILLDVREWPLTPWGIHHINYVVVSAEDPSVVLRAFRTIFDAEDYAYDLYLYELDVEEKSNRFYVFRGEIGKKPEQVECMWHSRREKMSFCPFSE